VATVGAKRVMFDTLEALFSGLSNPRLLRAEHSGAVSLAERSWFDHRHHCRTEAKAISLAMGWRNTYPIA